MKQILVISGKGGTGKTVFTGSLAAIVENKIMVDCDVDAADLHILLDPTIQEQHEFKSGVSAEIDLEKCINCGKCAELCRFDAIRKTDKKILIDSIDCEGCGFCSVICPQGAISMRENVAGEWYVSKTRFGFMVHAKLGIAEENSGKLVSKVRQKAKDIAEKENAEWIIIDGSPGIGCPVIASLSDVDLALIITEPTMSGLHDADRVIKVANHFKVPVQMIINKYDLNEEMTNEIEKYCKKNNIRVLEKIAFDETVVKALMAKKTIIEYGESLTKDKIHEIWKKIVLLTNGKF